MSRPTEVFVHRRRIGWWDTDAAAIAYTARFPQFCMEALEAWFIDRLGVDWYTLNRERGIGTPFVHLSIDFRSPLTPRDELATEVRLAWLGGSSLRFALTGRAGERLVFEGRFACVFVDAGAMRPAPAPEALRPALEREAAIGGVAAAGRG